MRLRTWEKIELTLGLDELTGRFTERQGPGRWFAVPDSRTAGYHGLRTAWMTP